MNTGNNPANSAESDNPKAPSQPEATAPGERPKEPAPAWLGSDVPTIDPSQSELTSTRRDFLTKVGVALGGLTGVIVVGPVIGFLFAPLFRKPPEIWRPVGPVSSFKLGETVQVTFEEASPLPWSGTTARAAAWLRRTGEQDFTVFTVQCTHLGCPVSWLSGAQLFMCPCHGGVYYPDGRVAAGPPPHSLPQYPVRVNNGQVELNVSAIPQSATGGQ